MMIYIKVRKGDYGLINKDGKEIVPCNFLYIGEVSEGIITMKASDKFIYVTKEGKLITKKDIKMQVIFQMEWQE